MPFAALRCLAISPDCVAENVESLSTSREQADPSYRMTFQRGEALRPAFAGCAGILPLDQFLLASDKRSEAFRQQGYVEGLFESFVD